MIDLLYNPPAIVWPLLGALVVLAIFHQLRERLEPLTSAIIAGLAKDAGRNSKVYVTALAFGISASLSAWVDAFKDLTAAQAADLSYWQLSAIFARILNPFIVAVLAYAYRIQGTPQTTETKPPFNQ